LVMAQLGMAFLLVAAAGLMVRAFWNLQQVDPGFRPQRILTFNVSLPQATYKDAMSRQNFWTMLQDRLNQIPGVQSATLMNGLPPLRRENDNDTQIEGFVPVPNGPMQNVAFWQVTGDRFFETLGARLMEGRFLEPRDATMMTPGVVVNAAMARTFWPHRSPIGRRVRIGGDKDPWLTVVGVVADLKNDGLNKPAATELFIPYRLSRNALSGPYAAIRTTRNPLSLSTEVRRVVASLDPSLPVAKLRTMDDVMAAASSRPRFLTIVLTMFSVLSLGLATVGVYGVIAYSVEQRTSEFGIRMALGAQPGQLLAQVIRQGLTIGIVGIGLGFLGALVFTRSLEGLLFGVSHFDTASFLVSAGALLVATVLASFLPAFRATRIQPITALRYE